MSDRVQPNPSRQLRVTTNSFSQPWQVIHPRIFRYLDKKYADEFFEDGSLRLSTFTRFGQHKDEQRKDAHEGHGLREGHGEDLWVSMVTLRGMDCYVLCGSTYHSRALQQLFPGADACFSIDDTLSFACEVAGALSGFKGGFEGPVVYQDNPIIERDLGTLTQEKLLEKYRQPDGNISTKMLQDLQGRIGGWEEYFLKHSRYAAQSEYRFLWSVQELEKDYIDIKVPRAIQFCRRIE